MAQALSESPDAVSSVLVLIASTLQILLPIIISLVAIDHILSGNPSNDTPDFGLTALNDYLSASLGLEPLLVACLMYFTIQIALAVTGHGHRLTLIGAVVNGLRDLRRDLFIHLETRPSSFYDRVSVGRVMTRVTNDIEALYDLLRGLGTLIGEFVPFFVALTVMFAIDVQLTTDPAARPSRPWGRHVLLPAYDAPPVPPDTPDTLRHQPEHAGEPRGLAGSAYLRPPGAQSAALHQHQHQKPRLRAALSAR